MRQTIHSLSVHLTAAPGGAALRPMSTSLPIRQRLNALPGRVLRAELKAVLIEICELAENGGRGLCDATNRYLAERIGLSTPDAAGRLVAKLAARGWVDCTVDSARGNRRSLLPTTTARRAYVLDAAGFAAYLESVGSTIKSVGTPREKCGEGTLRSVGRSPQKCGDLTTTSYEQETTKDKTLAADAAGAVASSPESNTPDLAAPPPRQKGGAEPAGFAAFYDRYPRKAKRPDAARAFARLSTADRLAATGRVESWFAARPNLRRPDVDARPYPASWLNARQWEDDDPTPLPAAGTTPAPDAVLPSAAATIARQNGATPRR